MKKREKEYLYFYIFDPLGLKIMITVLLIIQLVVIVGLIYGYYQSLLYQIVILAWIYLAVREYIRPNLILGEDYISLPKISLLFKRFTKEIKFQEIEKIELTIFKSANRPGKNILNNIDTILLACDDGEKYSLNAVYDMETFARDFKKRLGKENWKSKVVIDKWI